jgi:hypothetical protein
MQIEKILGWDWRRFNTATLNEKEQGMAQMSEKFRQLG